MKNQDERALAKLMHMEEEPVAPPAHLIGEILEEIPDVLPAMSMMPSDVTDTSSDDAESSGALVEHPSMAVESGESDTTDGAAVHRPFWRRQAWTRLAAVLAVSVLGGGLAYRLWLEPPSPPPQEMVAVSIQPTTEPARLEPPTTPGVLGPGQELSEALKRRDGAGIGSAAPPTDDVAGQIASRLEDREAEGQPVNQPAVLKPESPGKARFVIPQLSSPMGELTPGLQARPSPLPLPSPPPPPPPPSLMPVPQSGTVELQQETIVVSGELPSVRASSEVSTTYDFESIKQIKVGAAAHPSPSPIDSPQPIGQPAPSTGGTHEPNDAPYGDVFFKGAGTNPFIDTEEDRFSTFGLDVDTASFSLVRTFLLGGHLPPEEAVRVEEMLNYFDFDLAAPDSDDFAIHVDGGPTPFASGASQGSEGDRSVSQRYRLLRFGIRARDVAKSERKPVALTFVIDTSGSMEQGGRLELVKSSLFFLMSQLRPDDRLALVEYGSKGRVLLEPTYDHGAMREAIRGLSAGGSTNAAEGLTLGYQLASRFFREEGINRVVLCSDGVANVGPTGPDSILRLIGSSASSGIELSTVGFGMGNYNDVLMEQLANKGDGNYAYVDSISEAERVFGQELNGTLQTIGAEAKIQVEFEPDVVERYRLFGYENRDIADKSFRDDKVDAGEIGLGHTVSALYEIKLKRSFPPRRTIGTLRLRYRPQDEDEFVEVERRVTRSQLASNWKEMEPNARLAAVVAEFAEILRGSFWAKGSTFADLRREIDALESHFRNDKKFRELQSLVDMAATIEAGKESGEG